MINASLILKKNKIKDMEMLAWIVLVCCKPAMDIFQMGFNNNLGELGHACFV